MTVVSDSSVLIHLARIDCFSLLRRLYSGILIPSGVWRETVEETELVYQKQEKRASENGK